ncbi:hypothetical protein Nepgr_025814 [Nepenthes gracilis]|uniref:Uncharacterized protein n=1 Tax=Nepenthes gracilis TaxID=150966 RepID=A0AAD3Y1W7_NEPGR|nr:hypothetical protein Nepgr_025814 [Nepenthes gracilis]
MNREEEDLQFLGFNGVYTESIKLLVITSSKVFTETALSLALPLSFLMCSLVLSSKIIATVAANDCFFTAMFSERAVYFLVKAAYFTVLLVFGLVYTSVFSSTEELTVKQMTGIIPKLWKHLTSAFLWTFAIVFIYNVLASFIFVIWAVFFRGDVEEPRKDLSCTKLLAASKHIPGLAKFLISKTSQPPRPHSELPDITSTCRWRAKTDIWAREMESPVVTGGPPCVGLGKAATLVDERAVLENDEEARVNEKSNPKISYTSQ